jgi:predicted RNA-binding Zn ribbon-like protein
MNSTEKWRAYYSPVGRIRMLAGNPALDLANTLHWREGELLDFVTSYPSLVEWAEVAGLLTQTEKAALLAGAARQPEAASAIHSQWQDLRTTLKAWLPGIDGKDQALWQAHGDTPQAGALLAQVTAIAGDTSLATLFATEVPHGDGPALALPLLRSATAIWMLMTFPPAGFIRQCEADSCGGYFLDQSRAKPRRWCSMDSCGNRMKAERFRKSNPKT